MSAEIIVMKDMDMETYPANDEGTPKSFCIVGQPEPRSESGRPRLMNARYITPRRSAVIFYLVCNYLSLTMLFIQMSDRTMKKPMTTFIISVKFIMANMGWISILVK